MPNAYMMRQDAKMFPVVIHYYAADVDEALGASEWLYNSTMFDQTKELVIRFLAAYAKEQDNSIASEDVADTLLYVIKRLPYKSVSSQFIEACRPQFESLDLEPLNLSALTTAVSDALNQEFCRVRIGGAFNSYGSNRGIYFRISSSGFNWFNNIWSYVHEHKSQFDYITVMKDPEATGQDNVFYRHDGTEIKELPVEEFITLSGRSVFDSEAQPKPKPLFDAFSTADLMKVHRLYVRLLSCDPIF